ncbi:YqaA family protein [soil metagenome]
MLAYPPQRQSSLYTQENSRVAQALPCDKRDMAEEIILTFGYLGLFVVSFLAATLLPIGSELFVTLMVARGNNSGLIWLVATAGNYLGALTNYYVGYWGGDFLFARYIQVKPESQQKAQALYQRWGAPVLFFSWVPIVGDALTVISGTLKLSLSVFTIWVLLGKGLRYVVVIMVTLFALNNR